MTETGRVVGGDNELREAIGPILGRVSSRTNQGYVDRLRRARSWMAASHLHRADLDIRLLCYWIAVNAMYGGFSSSTSVREGQVTRRHPIDYVEPDLRDFATKLASLDREGLIAKAIRATGPAMDSVLKDKWHFSPYWNAGTTPRLDALLRDTAAAAKEALKTKRTGECLAILLGRVQHLRNHVAHGTATYRFSQNRDSVKAALQVLGYLVPAMVQVMEAPWAEKDIVWPAVRNPGKGTPQNPDSQGIW